MNKKLKDNKEWIELKATLRFVEEKILGIMDVNGWMMNKELEEQVKDLLSDRHVIMNKMFRRHVTEQEVARFREVNDHLLDLTQSLYDEHCALMDYLCVNFNENCYPGTTIQVESRLDVDEAAEVLHFDDDGDYGSNYTQMFDALAWTEDMEIRSFITNLGEKPKPDNLDDGTTWAEGCLDIPQFKDIVVCYAIHDLCTHKSYSVPDLLRIQSYSISHSIEGERKQKI
jgi:hypothetical protein